MQRGTPTHFPGTCMVSGLVGGTIWEAGHSLFKELQRNQSALVVLRAEDGSTAVAEQIDLV